MRLKIGRADKRRIRGALGIDFDLGKYNVGPTAFFEVPCRISVAADLARDFSVGAFTTISPSDGNGRFLHNLSKCKSYTMLDGNVCIKKCERPRDDRYDTQFTAPEWKWMDDLSLVDRLSPANIRRKTIVKLKYKLWKWLGKSLERSGAACVSMRFR